MSISRRRFLNASSIALPATLLTNPLSASDAAQPSATDIGYCQDMSVHHLQALAMCRRVLGRDTGGAVQAAAAEVLENQAMEVGQMRGWLTDWGASTVPPEIVMGWMGANQGDGMPVAMMPGYASDEQLLELSLQSGGALGKQWLTLMHAHHVGGVMMASQAKDLASSPKVVRLATLQIVTQNFEISQYESLLSGSYADF